MHRIPGGCARSFASLISAPDWRRCFEGRAFMSAQRVCAFTADKHPALKGVFACAALILSHSDRICSSVKLKLLKSRLALCQSRRPL